MIVKILSAGKSFSGLSKYLTHDPDAETDKRVSWTHTINCTHDHIPSAVDELLWTARSAELLKEEAGIRAGGRSTENVVKHFSLNWPPDANPGREHMIETTENFLRHMKWEEHQAVLVAHNDTQHAHVHVMLNAVHPETGLKLDDAFERRRAQAWSLEYEKEQGRIYCEQRLKNPADREDSPTRDAWLAFEENKREFERREKMLENQSPIFVDEAEKSKFANAAEWKILKDIQRDERIDFFAAGKSEFSELRNSIYREIREEFRERWNDHYSDQREGGNETALRAQKAEIIAEQRMALDERRDVACAELRKTRDGLYRELLDDQQEIRFGLTRRQETGLDSMQFLEGVKEREAVRDTAEAFREAGRATLMPRDGNAGWEIDPSAFNGQPGQENPGMKSAVDIGTRIGEGIGFGVLSIFESLADGIIGSTPASPQPRRHEPETPREGPFDAVIDDARKRQQFEREEADAEWRKRQRNPYGD
jgi:Relaxase/Mobilisation nuclease domain